MKPEKSSFADDANEEIPALIETLLATEQRLEELTGGEVDTVTGLDGRTFLLRRAQEQLRYGESAKRAAILNALPAHIALLDPQGIIITVNEAWLRFARANVFDAPGHGIGRNYLDVCDQARGNDASEAREVAAGIRAVLDGTEKSFSIEYPCHSPKEQRWFLLTVTPLTEGHPNGVVVMHLNITERKRSEQVIERGLQRLNEAQRIGQIGDWEWDLATQAITWSPQVFEIFGRDPSLGPPRDYQEQGKLYDAPSWTLMQEKVSRALESGEPQNYELVVLRPGGARVNTQAMAVTRKDESGKIVGLVGTVQDITARKRSEAALRVSEERLRAALLASGTGTFRWDFRTNEVSWDDSLDALFGLPPGQTVRSLEAFIAAVHPDDRPGVIEQCQHCQQDGADFEMAFRVLWSDGSIRWLADKGKTFFDAAGEALYMTGACVDITERKLSEVALEKAHQELLETSRQAGMAEVATGILHNVGNVLNSVNISAGLLLESVRKSKAASLARVVALLREHPHDLGEFITNDANGKHVPAHLAQLSEHLLADQQAIAGELDSLRRNVEHIKEIVARQQNYAMVGGLKEMIDVAHLAGDSLRLSEAALSRHGVEVIREFENVPLLNVEKHKVLQILVNLVRNAKYACAESARADKRLTMRVANSEGRVRISVMDNGVGIPPENLTRIFSHGFTTRKDGHGFGLHSGALAARELGGSLTVYSVGTGRAPPSHWNCLAPARENSRE